MSQEFQSKNILNKIKNSPLLWTTKLLKMFLIDLRMVLKQHKSSKNMNFPKNQRATILKFKHHLNRIVESILRDPKVNKMSKILSNQLEIKTVKISMSQVEA